jgi:hypothetical protein
MHLNAVCPSIRVPERREEGMHTLRSWYLENIPVGKNYGRLLYQVVIQFDPVCGGILEEIHQK